MAKRIVSCVLLILLFTLPCYAVQVSGESVPSDAVSFVTRPLFAVYKYSDDIYRYASAYGDRDVLSFTFNSRTHVGDNFIYPYFTAEGLPYSSKAVYQSGYTYYLQFEVEFLYAQDSGGSSTTIVPKTYVPYFSLRDKFASNFSPLDNGEMYYCSNYADVSYSYSVIEPNRGTFDIILHMKKDAVGSVNGFPKPLYTIVPSFIVKDQARCNLRMNKNTAYYDLSGTQYNQLVINQFNGIQGSLAGLENELDYQTEIMEDQKAQLESIDQSLNTIDQSVIAGNEQAHKDHEDMKKTIQDMQDKEKQEATENGNTDEAENEAKKVLSIDEFKDSMDTLVSALSYTGTDAKWVFPAAHDMPFLGDLWDEQYIDFGYWIRRIPKPVLAAVNFVFCFAFAFVVIREIMGLIKIISGGDDD